MKSDTFTSRRAITVLLILQFIPLLIFPPESYSLSSQEWWLPVLLSVLSLVAVLALLVRHSESTWPWDLISFAQGFNIISRLMMLMPHAMVVVDKADTFNTLYVLLSLVSIAASWLYLSYLSKPAVRTGVLVG